MSDAAVGDELLGDEALVELGVEAYVWGYPLVVTGGYWRLQIEKGVQPNSMVVGRTLLPKAYAPSMEILYTMAELDLSAGPLVLSVPKHDGRYYSFQFTDTFGLTLAYVGTRTCGDGPLEAALIGPGYEGEIPAGLREVRAPCSQVLMTTRTGVVADDPADMAAANAVIDRYGLRRLGEDPSQARPPVTSPHPLYELYPILRFGTDDLGFFDELCARMAATELPAAEMASARRFAPLGLKPGAKPSAEASPRVRAALLAAAKAAERQLETCDFATQVNGWSVILGVAEKIEDPLLRAYTTRYGCGFHIAKEALYFHCRLGPDGQRLNGARRYRLRFPGAPPAHAFWSINLMDLNMIPVPNPIERYNLSSFTEGLAVAPDGSFEVQIQHDEPEQGVANWLPAPEGDFFFTLRLYLPTAEAAQGLYRPPAVEFAE